jgi:transcriptional regulator with XRE-family HTH domain
MEVKALIDFVKVGCRIAERRRALGYSQEALARKLYVTRQAVSKWEKGISVPTLDTLCDMSKLFSVSVDELLGLFEPAPNIIDNEDIFAGHDRAYIISKIAANEITVNLPDVIYQMSPAERMYLLKSIKDGKLTVDIGELWVKLTPSEQKFLGGTLYEIQKGYN